MRSRADLLLRVLRQYAQPNTRLATTDMARRVGSRALGVHPASPKKGAHAPRPTRQGEWRTHPSGPPWKERRAQHPVIASFVDNMVPVLRSVARNCISVLHSQSDDKCRPLNTIRNPDCCKTLRIGSEPRGRAAEQCAIVCEGSIAIRSMVGRGVSSGPGIKSLRYHKRRDRFSQRGLTNVNDHWLLFFPVHNHRTR